MFKDSISSMDPIPTLMTDQAWATHGLNSQLEVEPQQGRVCGMDTDAPGNEDLSAFSTHSFPSGGVGTGLELQVAENTSLP
jgi:hypothetical protein